MSNVVVKGRRYTGPRPSSTRVTYGGSVTVKSTGERLTAGGGSAGSKQVYASMLETKQEMPIESAKQTVQTQQAQPTVSSPLKIEAERNRLQLSATRTLQETSKWRLNYYKDLVNRKLISPYQAEKGYEEEMGTKVSQLNKDISKGFSAFQSRYYAEEESKGVASTGFSGSGMFGGTTYTSAPKRNWYENIGYKLDVMSAKSQEFDRPVEQRVGYGVAAAVGYRLKMIPDTLVGLYNVARHPIRSYETAKFYVQNPSEIRSAIGRLGQAAISNPSKAIAVISSPFTFQYVEGAISRSVGNVVVKAGSKYVAPETVFDVGVMEGKSTFPMSRSVKESIMEFKNTKDATGMLGGTHATVEAQRFNPRKINIKGGPAGLSGKEDLGLFITPKGRGSPYFLKTGIDYYPEKISLNPLKGLFDQPGTVNIAFEKISRIPNALVKSKGFEKVNDFLKGQAGKGTAFITARSERGLRGLSGLSSTTRELEAVVPAGSVIEKIPGKSLISRIKGYSEYTTYEETNIPIREFKLSSEMATVKESIKSFKQVEKYSGSSARERSATVRVPFKYSDSEVLDVNRAIRNDAMRRQMGRKGYEADDFSYKSVSSKSNSFVSYKRSSSKKGGSSYAGGSSKVSSEISRATGYSAKGSSGGSSGSSVGGYSGGGSSGFGYSGGSYHYGFRRPYVPPYTPRPRIKARVRYKEIAKVVKYKKFKSPRYRESVVANALNLRTNRKVKDLLKEGLSGFEIRPIVG